jgi:excisionase family DNA binding protein
MTRTRPMTVAEAAETIGVSGDTVRRWADLGLLPVYRLPSGHRRFDALDIRRFRDHLRWGWSLGALQEVGRAPLR